MAAGDRLKVNAVFGNYETGLSADILKWGSLNDMDKEFIFRKTARIIFKKNQLKIGRVNLRPYLDGSLREILVDVNGEERVIPNWGKIDLAGGQYFKIEGVRPVLKGVKVDVRGFSLRPGKRDDAGIEIYPRDLIEKYSFQKKGGVYFVKIYRSGVLAGGFQVCPVARGTYEGQPIEKVQPGTFHHWLYRAITASHL